MLVYRVEDGTGEGPYNGETDTSMELLAKHRVDTHPGPRDDGRLYPPVWGDRTYYGGPKVGWLSSWFDGFGLNLRLDGYFVAQYDVPDTFTRLGQVSGQIAFNKDEATLVTTYPIDWL